MKKVLFIIILLVFIAGCSKPISEENLLDKDGLKYHPESKELYSGKVFKNHLGGKPYLEGSYKNGNKHGIFTYWSEDGLKTEINWGVGESRGLLTLFYENGIKRLEGNIKEEKGLINVRGLWKLYNQNGNVDTSLVISGFLSPFTKSLLTHLDNNVTIKTYFSNSLPPELDSTRIKLYHLLKKYNQTSNNFVRLLLHAPESDSELEEQARKDGIQPVQVQALENDQMVVKKVYLGMVLLFKNKKEIIPLIQSTAGLEYMISTKIKSLINVDKKTIGLMALDEDIKPKTENLTSQLNQHYNFRSVESKSVIPNDIDVLLVSGAADSVDSITIKNLSSHLKSGKKILMAQSGVSTDIHTQQASPIESNIFDFLSKYGLNLQKNLVLDSKCGNVQVQQAVGLFRMNKAVEYPFFPIVDTFNTADTVTSIIVNKLEQILPLFPSEIKVDTMQNDQVTRVTSLFSSSNNSGIMSSNFMLSPDPQQNPFLKILGQKGKILSALSLLNSGGEVMLISDSKFLSDESGMSIPDNMVFLMNAVDYLSGDENLISLRSKELDPNLLEMQIEKIITEQLGTSVVISEEVSQKEQVLTKLSGADLIGYDWVYPNMDDPMGAWKFNSDGTFNVSQVLFGGSTRKGKWADMGDGKVEIVYDVGGSANADKKQTIILTSKSNFYVGSTKYTRY